MSDYIWCHGPSCHELKTQDRIRGVKGSKVLRTRKVKLNQYVEGKMKTLSLGLKSYRHFDQAKKLADKVGVVLNETMMNESSSLALSI